MRGYRRKTQKSIIDKDLEEKLIKAGKHEEVKKIKASYRKDSSLLRNFAKSLLPSTQKVADKVLTVTGGKVLARGLGAAIAAPEMNRLEQQNLKTQEQLHGMFTKKLKAGGMSNEEKDRWKKILGDSNNVEVLKDNPDAQYTAKQIYGDAAQLSLTAAMGAKPGAGQLTKAGRLVKSGKVFKQASGAKKAATLVKEAARVEKYGKAGKIANLGIRTAKNVAKDAIIGGGAFGASAAAEGKSNAEIAKRAGMGAAISAGAPLGIGLAAKGVGKVIGLTGSKVIAPLARKSMKALEGAAAGKASKVNTGIDKMMAGFKAPDTIKQKVARGILSGVDKVKTLPTKFGDRFYAIRKYEDEARAIKGGHLDEGKNFYTNFREAIAAGEGRAEMARAALFGKKGALAPYRDILDDVEKRIVMEDFLARAGDGQKVASGQSADEIAAVLAKHKADLGANNPRVEEAVQVWNKAKDNFLDEMVEAGIKTADEVQAMKAKYPTHFPHKVLFDEIDDQASTYFPSGTFNVSKDGFFKAKGSNRQLEQLPFDAFVDRMRAGYAIIEKNKAMRSLVEAQEQFGMVQGMRALDTAEKVTARRSYLHGLNVLRSGVKEVLKDTKVLKTMTKTELAKFKAASVKLDKLANEAVEAMRGVDDDALAGILDNTKAVDKLDWAKLDGGKAARIADKGATQFFKVKKSEKALSEISERMASVNSKMDILSAARKGVLDNLKELRAGKKDLGEETVNFFRDGIKETWVVPKDAATAIKHLDYEKVNKVFRALTAPVRTLKALSTQYNISFLVPNKLRDKQTALLTADAFIDDMIKRTGMKNPGGAVNMDADELYKLWKSSGGGFGSVFSDGVPPSVSKIVRKNGVAQKFGSMFRIDKAIGAINQNLEESTRLAVFRKALNAGLAPKEAALVARDATVDFAKMGTWMQPLNQVVPFLNARVQGAVNMARSAIVSPETYARMHMWTTVYPTMAIHQWNRQFESSKNIPQYFYDQYWPIMVGETEGVDDNGNPVMIPKFVSIKKGEGQVLVSNPIQYFLRAADGQDPRRVDEMIKNTIGAASPVDLGIGGYNAKNPFLAFASQFGPIGNIVVGLGTNVDPFSGNKIIPESKVGASEKYQFKKTTPEVTKQLAGMMGVAPANLEFVMNSFGGVPQDLQTTADIATGLATDGELRVNPLEDSAFGKATKLPLARRFVRESTGYGSAIQQSQERLKGELQQEVVDKNLDIKEQAEKHLEIMNKLSTPADKLGYMMQHRQEIPKEVREKISQLKKSRKTVEVLSSKDSTGLRALYIQKRLLEMQLEGNSAANQEEFLAALEDAGILTLDVKKKLRMLQKQ